MQIYQIRADGLLGETRTVADDTAIFPPGFTATAPGPIPLGQRARWNGAGWTIVDAPAPVTIAAPPATITEIAALDFMLRFTPAEYAAIAASADPRAIFALAVFTKASIVALAPSHPDYAKTVQLMQLLVDAEVLTAARRDAILADGGAS